MGARMKVAFVGLGKRGRSHLDVALALRDRVEVVGLCDRNAGRLAAASRVAGPGVPHVRRVRDLLRLTSPDLVSLVVRAHQSPRLVRRIVGAGVAVLCEVPPAFAGPLLDRMIAAADATGVPLAAAENYIRTPLEQLKQKLIRADVFGEIRRADIRGYMGHKGHEFAMARAYVGADRAPLRVRARGEGRYPPMDEGLRIPARMEGRVEVEGGAVIDMLLSHHGTHRDWVPQEGLQYDFEGTRGGYRNGRFYLRGDDDGSECELPVEVRTADVDGVAVLQELVVASDPPVTWTNPFGDLPFAKDNRIRYYEHLETTPQAWEIAVAEDYARLADALAGGQPAYYPLSQSKIDLRLRLAMVESSRRGGDWVDWQEQPYAIEREAMRIKPRRLLRRLLRPLPPAPEPE